MPASEKSGTMFTSPVRATLIGMLLVLGDLRPASASETVAFNSESKVLHGRLYKPAGAGPYIQEQIQAAQASGGEALAAETMVRLLSTEQLQDQMAALAWLKQQPFVLATRIAAMGNSLGGIETVLGAEQGGYCAGVDASGAAESWDRAPSLQNRMLHAVQHAKSPIFFFQAENDYSLASSRTLYAAMNASHESAQIRIYPPYGSSPQQGHSFAYRGV